MRRAFLWSLIVSVGIAALLGCIALLSDEWSETQGKVLATSLTISATSLLALACAAGFERRRIPPVPLLGLAIGIASGAAWVWAIWAEPREERFVKWMASASIVAAWAAHASLLAWPALDRRHAWARAATHLAAAAVGAMLIWALFHTDLFESHAYGRTIGILSILGSAGTIVVPVLARLDARAAAPAAGARPVRFCPACGGAATADGGARRCPACGAAFRVEFL